MKKQYKILTAILVAEFIILQILSAHNIKAQTFLENILGVVIILIPVLVLLFFLSKEQHFSKRKKAIFKFLFWHLTFCTVLAVIGLILIELGIISKW